MSRITAIALLSATLLSACAATVAKPPAQPGMDQVHSNSIGFTGLSQEPF